MEVNQVAGLSVDVLFSSVLAPCCVDYTEISHLAKSVCVIIVFFLHQLRTLSVSLQTHSTEQPVQSMVYRYAWRIEAFLVRKEWEDLLRYVLLWPLQCSVCTVSSTQLAVSF